jgi:hypothetical protein
MTKGGREMPRMTTNTRSSTSSCTDTEAIRKKAYELWEKDGKKYGRDKEYWFKAEKIVKGMSR